jgi:hypothetical protein
MEDKIAANILVDMLKKYSFDDKEKEAISEAVGILSWSSLGQTRMKNLKSKRDKKAGEQLSM